MTIGERNYAFQDYESTIRITIKKNIPLIRALRLDIDDVCQELAICTLKAIESYDSAKGKSLKNFILYKQQFEILNMRQRLQRDCRSANVTSYSIDSTQEDDQPFEIPDIVDYDSIVSIQDILGLLTEDEKEVVGLRMMGVCLTDKKQRQRMDRIRRKVTKFYLPTISACEEVTY